MNQLSAQGQNTQVIEVWRLADNLGADVLEAHPATLGVEDGGDGEKGEWLRAKNTFEPTQRDASHLERDALEVREAIREDDLVELISRKLFDEFGEQRPPLVWGALG